MKKISLLVSMTLLLLLGFTNDNFITTNEGVQSKMGAAVDQIVTLNDSTQLGESKIVRSIENMEDSLEGLNKSLKKIENDITGNIEVFLIVGTALIAMGVAALKAVPQITYLHILNLKDSDRLSYDLQKTSIKDKSSFYIIFVAICMIATLSFVLTSYISMQIDSPFLMWLLGVIFSILVICYYIYLKKVECERNKKVLTVYLNDDTEKIWFLYKRTEEGDFIFSSDIYIEDYKKKNTKEFIIEYTEENSKEDTKIRQIKVSKAIYISNSMPKLKYLTEEAVINSFYGYAEAVIPKNMKK